MKDVGTAFTRLNGAVESKRRCRSHPVWMSLCFSFLEVSLNEQMELVPFWFPRTVGIPISSTKSAVIWWRAIRVMRWVSCLRGWILVSRTQSWDFCWFLFEVGPWCAILHYLYLNVSICFKLEHTSSAFEESIGTVNVELISLVLACRSQWTTWSLAIRSLGFSLSE